LCKRSNAAQIEQIISRERRLFGGRSLVVILAAETLHVKNQIKYSLRHSVSKVDRQLRCGSCSSPGVCQSTFSKCPSSPDIPFLGGCHPLENRLGLGNFTKLPVKALNGSRKFSHLSALSRLPDLIAIFHGLCFPCQPRCSQ